MVVTPPEMKRPGSGAAPIGPAGSGAPPGPGGVMTSRPAPVMVVPPAIVNEVIVSCLPFRLNMP